MGKAPLSTSARSGFDELRGDAAHRDDVLLALAHVATVALLGIALWILLTYTTNVGAAAASLIGIR